MRLDLEVGPFAVQISWKIRSGSHSHTPPPPPPPRKENAESSLGTAARVNGDFDRSASIKVNKL